MQRAEDLVLRDFNFCVIDEVDSILIDEARTPLIISGPAEKSSEKYRQAARLAEAMERDLHYTVDEKQKSILITEEGYEAAEDVLQVLSIIIILHSCCWPHASLAISSTESSVSFMSSPAPVLSGKQKASELRAGARGSAAVCSSPRDKA